MHMVYAVQPWNNGFGIIYVPSGACVDWYARKCDAMRVFNRRYSTYNTGVFK